MDGRERLELVCADAWRAMTEREIGEWRLRAADGFTGRANSALAVGDAGMPVARALDEVREFAHDQGIPAMAQTIVDSPAERAVAAAGWIPHTGHAAGHLVSVLVGPLARGSPDGVRILPEPTRDWWKSASGSTDPTPAQRHVLTTGEIGFGVAEITAGAARAAVVGDMLHIARLHVPAEHRRRGVAKALMAACGSWGARRGVTRCVLQVAVGNAPALALYAALGFTEHHRYRYWVPAWKDRSL